MFENHFNNNVDTYKRDKCLSKILNRPTEDVKELGELLRTPYILKTLERKKKERKNKRE